MTYTEVLSVYDEIVAQIPEFERKGKTMPYTSANGYMFSLVNKEGQFGIRLSKESQKKFIEEHNSGPFYSHGATMRDYVHVPNELLVQQDVMKNYLLESYQFVMSLPPK